MEYLFILLLIISFALGRFSTIIGKQTVLVPCLEPVQLVIQKPQPTTNPKLIIDISTYYNLTEADFLTLKAKSTKFQKLEKQQIRIMKKEFEKECGVLFRSNYITRSNYLDFFAIFLERRL